MDLLSRSKIWKKAFSVLFFTCLGPPSMTQRIWSVEVSANGTEVLSPSSPVKTKVDDVSETLWRLLKFKLHSILCWKRKIGKNSKRTWVSALLESMQSASGVTVFKIHKKSLIQHCERSELRLHFEWTKVIKNAKNGQCWRVFEILKLSVKQCY